MKKIIILLLSIILFNACGPAIPSASRPQPPVTSSEDPNTYDLIYPTNTLVGRNGNVIIGYMYEINGRTYLFSNDGGIIRCDN